MLATGRDVPGIGHVKQRGEGVAIVLIGPAIGAWKAGGKCWKAWNSRIIMAILVSGSCSWDCIHVLSCYAPTYASSREEKEAFFDSLQQAISAVPPNETSVMLGNFNSQVGSRLDEDEWWHVRGPHWYGETNEAGKELLDFLSSNEATVCNTWFQKKATHKQIWQHPKSKQWHCIDYVIMRQQHHRMCLDVKVMLEQSATLTTRC